MDEGKVTVTIKAGGGYDAPWIVYRGDSNDEVVSLIQTGESSGIFAAVGSALQGFSAAYEAGKGLGAQPVASGSPGPYQATQGAPVGAPAEGAAVGPMGTAPTCPHGTRIYRSGTSSRGNWQAWFCPTPKGDPGQCKPEWIKS